MAVLILIFLFPSVFLVFNPGRHRPSIAVKEVGLWIKENLPANSVIMATNSQVSYYAGRGMPVFSPYTEDLYKTLDYARYNEVEYIIVDEESTTQLTPQLQFLLGEGEVPMSLGLIYKYTKEPGYRIFIYKVTY